MEFSSKNGNEFLYDASAMARELICLMHTRLKALINKPVPQH
jgi:hypothetical protein